MGPVQGGESRAQAGLPQVREVADADARLPLLAPLLQASAPGSAVDYPLHDLMLHTNYTATVHGLRGPNVTSPASITFITGLEGPQDLEAKEVTPRTARLTWTEPQVRPTGYLLTYDTPGGQTQVPTPLPR